MLELVKPEERENAVKIINTIFAEYKDSGKDTAVELSIKRNSGERGIYTRPPYKNNIELTKADARGRYLMWMGGSRLDAELDRENGNITVSIKE